MPNNPGTEESAHLFCIGMQAIAPDMRVGATGQDRRFSRMTLHLPISRPPHKDCASLMKRA
jgi:hypothetical protein